jgi:hypothetical protein
MKSESRSAREDGRRGEPPRMARAAEAGHLGYMLDAGTKCSLGNAVVDCSGLARMQGVHPERWR